MSQDAKELIIKALKDRGWATPPLESLIMALADDDLDLLQVTELTKIASRVGTEAHKNCDDDTEFNELFWRLLEIDGPVKAYRNTLLEEICVTMDMTGDDWEAERIREHMRIWKILTEGIFDDIMAYMKKERRAAWKEHRSAVKKEDARRAALKQLEAAR